MPDETAMAHTVEAGTDGAMLCAFDPAALPPDFDARIADDPAGLLDTLRKEGRLWFGGTGGDGGFIVHVVASNSGDVPDGLSPAWQGGISLPSGSLWICGAEYIANDPRKGSAFTPRGGLGRYAMGDRIDLPPGRYALSVYEIDREDEEFGKPSAMQLLETVPFVLYGLGGLAVVFSGGALAVSLLIKLVQILLGSPLAEKGWHAVLVMLVITIAGAAAILLGRLIGRRVAAMPSVASANAAYEAERLKHPDLIFVMEQVAPAPEAAPPPVSQPAAKTGALNTREKPRS